MSAPLLERKIAGFEDPVLGTQIAFRGLLRAMSRPGAIAVMPSELQTPEPLHPATAVVCLTLFDPETPIWTDLPHASPALDWLRFHCGSPVTASPSDSLFSIITDPEHMPALSAFKQGDDDRPERSATLILQGSRLDNSKGVSLSGPGIDSRVGASLFFERLPAGFWSARADVVDGFPRGIDLILVCGGRLAALPRTTKVRI